MNTRQAEELAEILYPFFLKKLQEDGLLKNNVKMKNATVVSALAEGATNIDKNVSVKFPYDSTTISVPNKTGVDLKYGDLICLMYWVDLKNAVAMFKVS